MKCPINGKPCNKYKAFYVTEKVGSDVKHYSVCEDCFYTQFSKLQQKSLTCSNCGTSIETVTQGGRMGCAQCYTDFEEPLSYMISAIHNGNKDIKHVGKPPELWLIKQAEETNPIKFATELAYKLKAATTNEQYEMASFIKDKLDKFSILLTRLQQADEEKLSEVKKALAEFIYNFKKEEAK